MSEMTLCASDGCAVRKLCRRHSDCLVQYPVNPLWQSNSAFEPDKGAACYGFVDCSEDWRGMAP